MPSSSSSWLILLASHSSPFSLSGFSVRSATYQGLNYGAWHGMDNPHFDGPLGFGSGSKSSSPPWTQVRSLANGGSSEVEGGEAEDFGEGNQTCGLDRWIGQVMFGQKCAF